MTLKCVLPRHSCRQFLCTSHFHRVFLSLSQVTSLQVLRHIIVIGEDEEDGSNHAGIMLFDNQKDHRY